MANPPQTRTGAVQDTQRREEAAANSLSYVAADAEALRREADQLRQHLRAVGDNNTQLQRALQQASTELRVLQTSRWPPSTQQACKVVCSRCSSWRLRALQICGWGARLVVADTL